MNKQVIECGVNFATELFKIENPRKQLAYVFKTIDDLLLSGNFEAVDFILDSIYLDDLDDMVSVGFLTICYAARHKLTKYQEYLNKATEYFKVKYPDRYENLLKGFNK